MKVCPYCGRRIRYSSVYKSKKHGSYTCENERCKKECKVKIDNKMIIAFIALCLIVILFMIIWVGSGNSNNFFGVILVAALMLGFNFSIPLFMSFVPLKKYKDDIGRGKNKQEEIDIDSIGDTDFVFNREAFDKIKRQKELGMNNILKSESNNISSSSDNMVPVIEDVKEGHISSSDAPLQKINRQPRIYKNDSYDKEEDYVEYEEIKRYTPRKDKRAGGSKYTANRRF